MFPVILSLIVYCSTLSSYISMYIIVCSCMMALVDLAAAGYIKASIISKHSGGVIDFVPQEHDDHFKLLEIAF